MQTTWYKHYAKWKSGTNGYLCYEFICVLENSGKKQNDRDRYQFTDDQKELSAHLLHEVVSRFQLSFKGRAKYLYL